MISKQPILTTPEEEKHLELGIYQEKDQIIDKPDNQEEKLIRRSLEFLDAEVEDEMREIKEWKKKMYKDFENPTCPTVKELLDKCIQTLADISELKVKIVGFYRDDKMKSLLSELFGILENLTKQSEMLSDLLNSKGDPVEMEDIHKKYEHMGEFAMKINSRAQICWKTLRNCLEYLLKNLLLDLHKTVQHLFEKVGVNSEDTKANEIQIIAGKMRVVSEYLPLAAIFNPSDIFALNEDDPYLVDLKKHVQIKELGPSATIKKSFQKFIKGVHVGVSMLSKGAEQENILARKLTVSFGAVYYYICSNEAQKQTNLFYSRPTEKTAFQTWNILEDEFLSNMMKITLPSIKYAKKTYINRMYKPITLRTINDALNSNKLNSLSPLIPLTESKRPHDEVTTLATKDSSLTQVKLTNKDKIPILVLSNKNLRIHKFTELEISQKQTSSNTVDIVAEKHIENPKSPELQPGNREEPGPGDKFMNGLLDICRGFGCLSSEPENYVLDPYFDGLIIHIHGGGFVSMSASSHQNYTRQWSKIAKKAVLSIDYRLAPEHQYPNALDDCWQAYCWIVKYAEEVLGIRPSKIVLTGDSAGANLSLGVTALAIKHGIKPPDGLFLAYPALRLENKTYSPSLMLALEDQIVPYSLLRLCIQSYVPVDADPSQDPFLSPIHMTEDILKKLPPIKMIVGSADPLHDDCWRFTDKLRKLGNDVSLTVYKDMCHGFLGYDMPMGMPEAKACVQDSAQMISELFNIKKKS